MEIVIFIAFFLLIYGYFLYPILLALLAKIIKRPIQINESYQPFVTIVIAAYNEDELIEEVIESIYKSDYPQEKIKILVGSDGSTDRTNDILGNFQNKKSNFRFFALERSGKNAVLNALYGHIDTEIVIFLDADTLIFKGSIKKIVTILSDTSVGCVISQLKIKENGNINSGGFGERLYQNYESQIRINESKIFSTINSLGAFYGIKSELHDKLPNNYVCDDLYNVYNTIYQKKRVIFDEDNLVEEFRIKSLNKELNRKIRIASGGLATALARWQILMPNYGWSAFFLWSHKILRYMSPINMLIILIGTFFVDRSSGLFDILLYSQIIFYGLALFGWLFEKVGISSKIFKIPFFFVSMNVGLLLGILRFLKGKQNAKWNTVGLEN